MWELKEYFLFQSQSLNGTERVNGLDIEGKTAFKSHSANKLEINSEYCYSRF